MCSDFFDFGTNIETVKACLSLIERGCRGEIRRKQDRKEQSFRFKKTSGSRDKYQYLTCNRGEGNRIEKEKVLRMRNGYRQGLEAKEIAKSIGCSLSVVYRYWRTNK